MATAPRHSLGVVTGAGAHHPRVECRGRKPGDEVEGAPDLVGADHLEVLAFDVDRRAVTLRQALGQLQRGAAHHRGETRARGDDVVESDLGAPVGDRRGVCGHTHDTTAVAPVAYGVTPGPRPTRSAT